MQNQSLIGISDFDLAGVARRLRLAREHAKLTQQDFADLLGYSRRQINAWENASNAPPIWVLRGIRQFCNISPEWVLSGPGDVPLTQVHPSLDRAQRVHREVSAMAKDLGLELPAKSIDNFAKMILQEPVEVEKEAKKWVGRAIRALL